MIQSFLKWTANLLGSIKNHQHFPKSAAQWLLWTKLFWETRPDQFQFQFQFHCCWWKHSETRQTAPVKLYIKLSSHDIFIWCKLGLNWVCLPGCFVVVVFLSIQLLKNQCRCCYTHPVLARLSGRDPGWKRTNNVCQWYLKGRAEVITCIRHKRQTEFIISAWSPMYEKIPPKCIISLRFWVPFWSFPVGHLV